LLGGSEQLALGPAARAVHVDAVIPLSHTVAAQANGNGMHGTLQTGVAAGALALIGGQGRGRAGQAHPLAQIVQGFSQFSHPRAAKNAHYRSPNPT
jgi:hypothetical protein